jgi:hypothetical protein
LVDRGWREIRGARTAVRKILVPAAWKTASNEEIHRENPGSLGVQELPPGRA